MGRHLACDAGGRHVRAGVVKPPTTPISDLCWFVAVLIVLRCALEIRAGVAHASLAATVLIALTIGYVAALIGLFLMRWIRRPSVGLALGTGIAAAPWVWYASAGRHLTVVGLWDPALDLAVWAIAGWCAAVFGCCISEWLERPASSRPTENAANNNPRIEV